MGNHQPLFNDRYPDDVIGLILMKVDILTLTLCPRICKQFARVLRSQYFWKHKVAVDFGPKPKINPDGWSQDHPSGADPNGRAMNQNQDFRRYVFRLVNSPNRRIVTTYAMSESREPLLMKIDKKKERFGDIGTFAASLNLGVTRYDYWYKKDYEYTICKRHNYRFDLMEILI